MKRQVEVIQELKTGRLLSDLRSILKSYPHLRCNDFCLRYTSFLAYALDNSGGFCSWLTRGLL